MEQILKDFIDNNEATDAYVTSKVTYISLEDVDSLLKKQKQALTIPVVVGQSEQLFSVLKYAMPTNYKDLALERIVKRFIEDSK